MFNKYIDIIVIILSISLMSCSHEVDNVFNMKKMIADTDTLGHGNPIHTAGIPGFGRYVEKENNMESDFIRRKIYSKDTLEVVMRFKKLEELLLLTVHDRSDSIFKEYKRNESGYYKEFDIYVFDYDFIYIEPGEYDIPPSKDIDIYGYEFPIEVKVYKRTHQNNYKHLLDSSLNTYEKFIFFKYQVATGVFD